MYVQITSYNVLYHGRESRMVVINDVTPAVKKRPGSEECSEAAISNAG